METAIFYITLDIDDAYSHVSMNLHQGESGRKISASFSQSSKPYPISEGCHAVFAGTVPGGQVFFNDCVIENECVICEIPAQITSLFGLVKAEIRLYGDRGSLIASPAFTINVVESAMADGALLERIEVTALTELIGQAKEAVAECKSSVIDEVELSYQENGGEASAHAQLEENEDGRTLQLHFSNLKGEVGEQGPKGDKGDKGDKGETGDIGPAGKDGVDCTPLALGAYVSPTAAGDIASFDDGADGIPVKSLVVDIEPVQAGTGEPSPENVRPISGWTGAKVTRTGKNLLDPAYRTTLGKTNVFYYRNKGFSLKGGVTYTFSADAMALGLYIYEEPIASPVTTLAHVYNAKSLSYTPETDVTVSFDFYNTAVDASTVKCQLELGNTATDFEPYQSDTYDISFPDEAGTVYGGTLDVTSGVLTVDRAEVDLGTLEWLKPTSANNYYATTPKYNERGASENFICSRYKFGGFVFASPYYGGTGEFKLWGIPSNAAEIYIHDDNYTDVTSFKTAMSGVQFVYELATPITYQLTPTEVNTLLGVNNVYSDTGDTEVTYRADPTLIYNKLAAAIISSGA